MGLSMSPELAFRSYRQQFSTSESEHLTRVGALISAEWQAHLDIRFDRMMFRYADTVRELHLEIENQRQRVALLGAPGSQTHSAKATDRGWRIGRR